MSSAGEPVEASDRLAALQHSLQALERGEPLDEAGAGSSRAIRIRRAALTIDRRIAQQRAEAAQRGLEALQERMNRIVDDARNARNRVPLSFESERRSGIGVYWSPVPVLAFRAWLVSDSLYGAFGPWTDVRIPLSRGHFGLARHLGADRRGRRVR